MRRRIWRLAAAFLLVQLLAVTLRAEGAEVPARSEEREAELLWDLRAESEGVPARSEQAPEEGSADGEKIEFFYENVCASCEGDADFFRLYEECLSDAEREQLRGRAVSYNVFLDSCREYYNSRSEELGIPQGTALPVLIAGGRWVSGMEQMEALLHETADESVRDRAAGDEADDGDPAEGSGRSEASAGSARDNAPSRTDSAAEQLLAEQLLAELAASGDPAVLLFTTEACEDCEEVKDWLAAQQTDGRRVMTYNIIQDPCLELLKCMFREYGVAEQDQKVPAVFYGDSAATGAAGITALTADALWQTDGSPLLLSHVTNAKQQLADVSGAQTADTQSMLTLLGAGLLGGLNPCSISMLLMLISMVVAEKSSVWKTGLLYLCGKYVTYLAAGMGIYASASMIDGQLLSGAGRILERILAVLFAAAGVLYLIDAVQVRRQEYGKIRTQLPTGLRRWNHRLIRRAGSYSGALKPLLIIGLGMAVSVGEFFCTGQIYMASITYLLRSRVSGVWPYFLVYVTAMSLPALLMLAILQKTRNTEHISEFMLRHLGAVKLFSALLFLGYAVYFFVQ